MNRRDILKYTSLTFGVVATGGAMSALLSGCKVEPKINFTPEFLSLDEVQTVTSMADIIFPKTSTPSASEVGVPEFMDGMLANVADMDEKGKFKEGMVKFNETVKAEHGKSYNDLDEATKLVFLTKVDVMAFSKDENKDKILAGFWRGIKGDTYFGYFSSEKVAKEVLVYSPVPGVYEGCVDLIATTGGKTWAY
jgi:gluconate 2-dehydrogenase gamma chain